MTMETQLYTVHNASLYFIVENASVESAQDFWVLIGTSKRCKAIMYGMQEGKTVGKFYSLLPALDATSSDLPDHVKCFECTSKISFIFLYERLFLHWDMFAAASSSLLLSVRSVQAFFYHEMSLLFLADKSMNWSIGNQIKAVSFLMCFMSFVVTISVF